MLLYLSLFLISLLSGCLIFVKTLNIQKRITSLLSFSGAYLLGICFLHLIPELFEEHNETVGMYLLIGFFLQLILDYFSGGIEHGHAHVNKSRLGKFPLLVFLSLGLHAFLESLPLEQLNNNDQTIAYLVGLLIHKIPIAIILGSLLVSYQLKKTTVFLSLLCFAFMGPLGVFVGSYFDSSAEIFQQFLAIAIGIILHLSTTILLESNEEHHVNIKKLVPLIAGVSLALLTLTIH